MMSLKGCPERDDPGLRGCDRDDTIHRSTIGTSGQAAPGAPGDGEPVGETVGGATAPTAPGGADRPRPGVEGSDRRETAAGPENAPIPCPPPCRGPGGSVRRGPEEFSGEPDVEHRGAR